jgi:4-hydroxythreonine-4-phosphate dehydrogenase
MGGKNVNYVRTPMLLILRMDADQRISAESTSSRTVIGNTTPARDFVDTSLCAGFVMIAFMTTDSTTVDRPLIALTMGDCAGIGPEVLVQTASDPEIRAECRLVAIGHPVVLSRAAELVGCDIRIESIPSIEAARDLSSECLPCFSPCADDVTSVEPGQLDARAGKAAFDCLAAATYAALAAQIDGIVTAPLNKAALHAAGHIYPGHTEILADICGVSAFGMMLYLPPSPLIKSPCGLGVVHSTLHTSIRSVPDLLDTSLIADQIQLMDGFLRRVGCETPRVGVCALNPHAGEDGLFGDEERTIIAPAVEQCREHGIQVTGPIPADALLRRAVGGEFDGIVAMYHDQGHIALKLIGFERAVNITLGLPIVRTSPSHGTAFDIAWHAQGPRQVSAEGMIEATRMAVRLVQSGRLK